jgi:uncharacterized protein YndB with AHSA1/START domain
MQRPEVHQSIWINAALKRVWQAITDPQQLQHWYAPDCRWEFPSVQVGETVKFYNTATDILTATVETVDAPQLLTLRWEPDAEYPAFSQVTDYRLEPADGGTRITMSEGGYDLLPEHARQERIEMGNTAYAGSLENLKALLESDNQ